MRKNCREVLDAWRSRKPCTKAESIWTDGEAIYSYSTCLVTRYNPQGDTDYVFGNFTTYSRTTTTHQNALRSAIAFTSVADDLPMGISAAALVDHCTYDPSRIFPLAPIVY